MPVDCSFAECDQPVAGQCRRCDRKFCAKHRFVTPQGAAILDLCLECARTEAESRAYADAVREESLASIRESVRTLLDRGVMPPDAFVWSKQTESRWWAFGRFGRREVAVPIRRGWPVGDFPWQGAERMAPSRSAGAVYVRPTYVDTLGEIAPRSATRASIVEPSLFTDEMCRQVAEAMRRVVAEESAQAGGTAASAKSSMAGTSNEW